jgi:hypothetical protein
MPNSDSIRLPGSTHKLAVVGRTGSGKTFAAVWHLSNSDFDIRPWVIIDYKRDDLINGIERARPISYDDEIPNSPGIYILQVLPGEEEELSDWFRRAWEHEGIGIYVDEGYMVDRNDKWFNACLTQGRSKHIPMIILSQRPVWLSRFVFSEADFFQVFDLTHSDDMKKVKEYIRDDDRKQLEKTLPTFHSFYYDVGKKKLVVFSAVPDGPILLDRIDERLEELDEKQVARRRAF